MIPDAWRSGEIAVLGLGKSGSAVATLLAREGTTVYASDSGTGARVEQSAAVLRTLGVDVQVGGHDLDRIRRACLVVASPGIPPTAPPIAAARESSVPVVGELEVALHAMPDLRYVAVTGTNGKTTTTALVAHLLRALGLDATAAGNIGTPLAEVACRETRPDWVALEMSSFQLHDTPNVEPTVGVVTNLAPDHLDRYAGPDEYYADKALIFRNMSQRSRWVLNGDQAEVLALHERLPADRRREALRGEVHRFSLGDAEAEACFDREGDVLVLQGRPLLPRAELPLLGDHNVANALCAVLSVAVADPAFASDEARSRIADGLRSFRALPHRMEVVGEWERVQWINDSKATNVSSTLVAIEGMRRPTVLLLGGRHKGEPYSRLAEPLRRTGRAVIAYGEAAPIVEADLAGVVPLERMGSSFDEVIARARELAQPGDAVLLSPACSSYDMFDNYEQRGAAFRRLAAPEE